MRQSNSRSAMMIAGGGANDQLRAKAQNIMMNLRIMKGQTNGQGGRASVGGRHNLTPMKMTPTTRVRMRE